LKRNSNLKSHSSPHYYFFYLLSINFVLIIASKKSSICQEISSALQHVIQTFPNRCSSLKQNIGGDNTDNFDNNNNKNKKTHVLKNIQW